MSFFIGDLYAATPQGDGGSAMPQVVMIALIFLIFYFLVIRPQQKKIKDHQQLVKSLNKGDQVVTQGGIYGKVNKIFDAKDFILLEIAERTIIKIQKSQVQQVLGAKSLEDKPSTKGKDKDKDKS